jgi:hypothetical protein
VSEIPAEAITAAANAVMARHSQLEAHGAYVIPYEMGEFRADIIAVLEAAAPLIAAEANARLAELENAISWNTSCTSCAAVLDSSYREHCRREAAEELLTEACGALRDCYHAALTVKPTLDVPYQDAPETTPWRRFAEAPARRAHDLRQKIRKHLRSES